VHAAEGWTQKIYRTCICHRHNAAHSTMHQFIRSATLCVIAPGPCKYLTHCTPPSGMAICRKAGLPCWLAALCQYTASNSPAGLRSSPRLSSRPGPYLLVPINSPTGWQRVHCWPAALISGQQLTAEQQFKRAAVLPLGAIKLSHSYVCCSAAMFLKPIDKQQGTV
jgi:hypothetical protein